ncbi:MAG: addiction module protein [Ancrocorticia sp.]
MTSSVLEAVRTLMELSPEDRAEAIEFALLSLNEDNASDHTGTAFTPDQVSTFRRRIEDIESGRVQLLTGDDVDAAVAARIESYNA